MTDKEKLAKVRAEIERRYKYNKEHENDWAGTSHFWQRVEDEEILSFIDSMQEEPVSEDLEKASFDNAQKNYKEGFRGAAMQAFNEGADWHMAQMMKNAVEKEVGIEEWGHLVVYVDDLAVKIGDKVTVIIIKEDEK